MQEITLKNGKILKINEGKAEDAQELLEYVNQIAGESDNLTFGEGEFDMSEKAEKAYLKMMKERNNSIYLIGWIDDEIVSTVTLNSGQRPRIKHLGELSISVKKKYWRIGIGREMMNCIIGWGKNVGIRKINLKVRVDNNAAIQLYKSLGFSNDGIVTRELFINNNFVDVVHMGLEIDP